MAHVMTVLPGVSSSLWPSRYLADRLMSDAERIGLSAPDSREQARVVRWWTMAGERCGPASGLHAIFDAIAMPLAALLGFTAGDVHFDTAECRLMLRSRTGVAVPMLLLPWAATVPSRTQTLARSGRDAGAAWAFLLAPPFLSLGSTRGAHGGRAVTFFLPVVVSSRSCATFLLLSRAAAFDVAHGSHARGGGAAIDELVASGASYQAQVGRDLRQGVTSALEHLSQALASLPSSTGRRRVTPPRARDEALSLVYRILFLLYAEAHDLVPHDNVIYRDAYAMAELCRDAAAGSTRGLWEGLAAITRMARVGVDTSYLRVAPFNGPLFARGAVPRLEPSRRRPTRIGADARAAATRDALVALGTRPGRHGREGISFRDLGVEQLGTIYEHVLDLTPESHTREPLTRTTHAAARKQTGSFYTPQPLTDFLVRRTLEPLVQDVASDAILRLRVVDPAMGSGAFLVATCRFLADAYEDALVREGSASATDFDDRARADIRRQIAERCLWGVDRNPTAVQLARLSLWLTTLARDRPLTFLDHRLRVGDSLVGARPADLARAPGRIRREAPLPLFDPHDVEGAVRAADAVSTPLLAPSDSLAAVRAKEAAWRHLIGGRSPLAAWRTALNLWCAGWFWPDGTPPPDAAEIRALVAALTRHDTTLPDHRVSARVRAASAAADRHAFFHWSLEFADVFHDRLGFADPSAGFDAIVGNPPWEMVRDDEREADDADAQSGRDRRRFLRFIRESGAFPSCDRGHLNLYQPFADRACTLVRPGGRIGLLLPWGLATDDGTRQLRRRLLDTMALTEVVGFDNAAGLFPIHRGVRFAAVLATSGQRTQEFRVRCGVRAVDELTMPSDATPIRLTPGLLQTLTGPSIRIPAIVDVRDLEWLRRMSSVAPRLGSSEGWHATFGRELNATESARDFGSCGLPIVEGKHLRPFGVDTSGVTRRIDPTRAAARLPQHPYEWPRVAYRDVSSATNRYAIVAAIVPSGCVTTHTVYCLRTRLPIDRQRALCALLNSYVLNAFARLLMGGHLTTTLVEALPAPAWGDAPPWRRLAQLIARLEAAPDDQTATARVQARVAWLYAVTPAEFGRILALCPLIPEGERALAARILDRFHRWRTARDAHLVG